MSSNLDDQYRLRKRPKSEMLVDSGFKSLAVRPGVGRGPCPVRHSDRGVSGGPAIHGSVWLGVFNHV